ncbi:hypothetical protein HMPREF0290_1116 [Corynebacterium efficiens YS-314]|nr:hypothetical protein HMPREF0290_1116 [Corynebacterium efficiens YS-314]
MRDDFGVDAGLTHSSCDQLRVLCTVVDNEYWAMIRCKAHRTSLY